MTVLMLLCCCHSLLIRVIVIQITLQMHWDKHVVLLREFRTMD